MDKICVFLAVALIATAASAAAASIEVTPISQGSCCGIVQYSVKITNDLSEDRSFELIASADEGAWASLEPKMVVVAANSEETLTMFAKADCPALPGEYRIKVFAKYIDRCNDVCGGPVTCKYKNATAEAILAVGDGCPQDEPRVITALPKAEPILPIPNATSGENQSDLNAPTGAVVASGDSIVAIAVLFGVLAFFIIALIALQRSQKK